MILTAAICKKHVMLCHALEMTGLEGEGTRMKISRYQIEVTPGKTDTSLCESQVAIRVQGGFFFHPFRSERQAGNESKAGCRRK